MNRIYLDYAATTPLLPEAKEAMEPWLGPPANPSSLHAEGRLARSAVDKARETLAAALGCLFGEVVFTSGGTESANLAILGAALANKDSKRKRILFGAAEHHCVLHTAPVLLRLGYDVQLVPVDRNATVSPETLEQCVDDDVLLISVMTANNEVGSLNPVAELVQIAHDRGVLFHTDAVQTFPFNEPVEQLGADLLSTSAHKLYGPAGIGALYVHSGTELQPLALGGGQEREVRAGTENVAGIVGFATSVQWCLDHHEIKDQKQSARDEFAGRLKSAGFLPTLANTESLPGHFHCRYPGIDADSLLIRLDRMGVSASSGAACSSGSLESSHVLLACGYSNEGAKEGLRFTFGKDTTLEDAQEAASRVIKAAHEILDIRQHHNREVAP